MLILEANRLTAATFHAFYYPEPPIGRNTSFFPPTARASPKNDALQFEAYTASSPSDPPAARYDTTLNSLHRSVNLHQRPQFDV